MGNLKNRKNFVAMLLVFTLIFCLIPIGNFKVLAEEGDYSLEVKKSADKTEFEQIEEVITYTYSLKNTGRLPIDLGNPTGYVTLTLVDDKIGTIDLSSAPEQLLPNESFSVNAEYKITQNDIKARKVTNEVTATLIVANDFSEDTDTLTLPMFEPYPELEIIKSADKSSFSSLGEKITYKYRVRNIGNVPIEGSMGATVGPFTLIDNIIGTIDTSSMPYILKPGEKFEVTAEYKVIQKDIDEGFIRNRVDVVGIYYGEEIDAQDSVKLPYKMEEVVKPKIEDKLNMKDHIQYFTGYPDNTVRPEAFITREEVSAVFFRLLTPQYRDVLNTTAHSFKDVKIGRWSEKHIATLAKGNIIQGYKDGNFRPAGNITRAELATIASRFDDLTPFISNKFTDIETHWANQYINSASEKGWVNGYEDGTFKPDQFITRAEFVTLVNNVLNRKVMKENILPNAKQFSDLSSSKWYYEAMQEAINSHNYTREQDEEYEIWTDIYYPTLEM